MALSWDQILGILLIIGTLYLRSRSEDNTPMPSGKAIEVDNDVVFKALISSGPVIVDFYATWCGPCKAIAPKIAQWSEEHTNIRFLKVDVDKMRQIASTYGITAMPTFIVFKDGQSVQTIRGANVPELQNAIQSLSA
ncbi:thioredoxin, putative [Talaromyces islandicus]|uniref:Thioredoxin, putative n=1 Tax=Talaromyces islandicus TaxID=28573 RepID=A0A0U1LN31_TALIS|nr:thioredoxin, putative [Talaromyces islandicus]